MAAVPDIISFESMPVGCRFQPTDEECLTYLKKRICGNQRYLHVIPELNVYDWDPGDLPQKFRDSSVIRSKDQEWWFICPLQYTTSSKSKIRRKTKSGYWKTTGEERIVKNKKGEQIGVMRTLVFRHNCDTTKVTDWVMHEYRLIDKGVRAILPNQDDFALYRVMKRSDDVSNEFMSLDSDDEEAEHMFPEETIQAKMKSYSDLLVQPVNNHSLTSQSHSFPQPDEFDINAITRGNPEYEHNSGDDDYPASLMQIDLEGDSGLRNETLTEVHGQRFSMASQMDPIEYKSDDQDDFIVSNLEVKSCREEFYLVGKIIADREVNMKIAIPILQRAWKNYGGVIVSHMRDDLILMSSNLERVLQKIMELNPWSVMGYPVILCPWDPTKRTKELDFSCCFIWIQIMGLPLQLMTESNAKILGGRIGEVIEVESCEVIQRDFLRVHIKFPLNKPLIHGLWIKNVDGSRIWAGVRYERLPDFCFACGIIGHTEAHCEVKENEGFIHRHLSQNLKVARVRKISIPESFKNTKGSHYSGCFMREEERGRSGITLGRNHGSIVLEEEAVSIEERIINLHSSKANVNTKPLSLEEQLDRKKTFSKGKEKMEWSELEKDIREDVEGNLFSSRVDSDQVLCAVILCDPKTQTHTQHTTPQTTSLSPLVNVSTVKAQSSHYIQQNTQAKYFVIELESSDQNLNLSLKRGRDSLQDNEGMLPVKKGKEDLNAVD